MPKNSLPTTLRELVTDALSYGLDGPQIDALVAASAFNVLDAKKPVPALIVKVPTTAAFRPFIRESKTNAVFINYKTRFISIFPPSPGGLPIPRVYVVELQDLFKFGAAWREFETSGIQVTPMRPEEFDKALDAAGYELKLANYLKDFRAKTSGFRGLAKGGPHRLP